MAKFVGNAHWAEPSPLVAIRARPTPLKCKNEYLVLALEEETAVQAVVGSIVWAFRRLKKPRCRDMSARGYELHSVCPQLSFSYLTFRYYTLILAIFLAFGKMIEKIMFPVRIHEIFLP